MQCPQCGLFESFGYQPVWSVQHSSALNDPTIKVPAGDSIPVVDADQTLAAGAQGLSVLPKTWSFRTGSRAIESRDSPLVSL